MNSHPSTSNTSSEDEENEHLLDKEYSIFLSKQLGKGGFGQLFLGKNLKNKKLIAIKCEESVENSHLILEFHILRELYEGKGIPEVYKIVKGHRHNYMVMELLGKSLDRLFNENNRKFSIKTVSEIGYQMVERIEFIHKKEFLHRDIKPGNFLMGRGEKKQVLFLIDFGLAKRYIDKRTKKHIPYKEGKGLTGTARYVSLFTHKGIEQGRRDDIEGIAYNLIYMALGKLPWQGVKCKNKKERHRKIMEMKMNIKPEKLCAGLPEEFPTLLIYARALDFDEEPDYKNIMIMFKI